jgi:hypothetical protein
MYRPAIVVDPPAVGILDIINIKDTCFTHNGTVPSGLMAMRGTRQPNYPIQCDQGSNNLHAMSAAVTTLIAQSGGVYPHLQFLRSSQE